MDQWLSVFGLIILAIVTQHIVSWAGSMLSSIGSEESNYAVFTFSDDRRMSMTTNILMNICIPNVFMVFIFMLADKYEYFYVKEFIIFYVVSFFVYRLILICLILRRKEMYSPKYEFGMALAGIGLAFFLKNYFFTKEKVLFIQAYELREELWFAIIIVLFQFLKQIFDKKVKQDDVLTKGQISQYIIHKFVVFYEKFHELFDVNRENRDICVFTYAVMIFEDYNRGPLVRKIERLKTKRGKSATVGIMQVRSDEPLSDEDSILQFYEWAWNNTALCDRQLQGDEMQVNSLAWEHNNDTSYAQSVAYIFNCLCEYIDKVPKYRKAFHFREYGLEMVEDQDCVKIENYRKITCNNMTDFCENVSSNMYLELYAKKYNVLEGACESRHISINKVYDGREMVIFGVDHLFISGRETEIVTSAYGANVIVFKNCSHLVLENVMLGHFPEQGFRDGAALRFENCTDIQLCNLKLFNCGTYGILYENGSVTISNCKIYRCAYGAIRMKNVAGIIDNLEIYDCKNTIESIVNFQESSIIMKNTKIHDNSSQEYIIKGDKEDYIFENIEVWNNSCIGSVSNVISELQLKEWNNNIEPAG